ncbi:hypothetical protein, partial [Streptomyces tricolor]
MCPLPTHESLVAELRELRRRGLPGLRHCTRDALREAAVAAEANAPLAMDTAAAVAAQAQAQAQAAHQAAAAQPAH